MGKWSVRAGGSLTDVDRISYSAGNTVVEVISSNALLGPFTSVLYVSPRPRIDHARSHTVSSSTMVGATLNPLSSSTTRPSTTVSLATSTSSTPQGGGVVGQPVTPTVEPYGPTPFQYTTTNGLGQATVVQGIFTPTAPPTTVPSPTMTGTVLDYSAWLGMIGTNTVPANAASRLSSSISAGWYCLVGTILAVFASGAWIIVS